MKRLRLAAMVVLIGLVAVRVLFPEFGNELRGKLKTAVERELDYVEAFYATATPSPESSTPVQTPVPAAAQPRYVYVTTESAAAPSTPTPEPTPTPLPEAVTVFLESQAAFADYELPETVDYSYVELPLAYTVPVSGYNSSGFGYRVHPILNTVRFHYGTDFAANSGENVLAFADGTVTYAGYDDSFGWRVEIDHGDGWKTLYAHCSKLYVWEGQQVNGGAQIALVGATGMATGPHLHFELTRNGKYLNPEYYINQ